MSLDCTRVSDAIWKSINEGMELTAEELQHIKGCGVCADILVDAQTCIEALNCVKSCPPAPDCRSAVMARISSRRARFAPAWAYACIVIVIAVMLGTTLLRHDSRPRVTSPAARLAKTPDYTAPKAPQPVPETKPEFQPIAPKPSLPSPKPVVHEMNYRHYASVPHKRQAPSAHVAVPPAPKPAEEKQEPVVTQPQGDSSALAYVTWQTGSQPDNSYHYSYTSTDPATGEVTSCTVKRDGNAVEVNMESDPVKPEAKPGKESKIDEAVSLG